MTWHNMPQTTLGLPARRLPGTFLNRPLERLLALVHEWRTRRNIERGLGQLSNFLLRDVGLTKADEVDGSRSRHLSATVGLLSGNPSKGAIRHADYHRGP
jgi:uncharacterized protein YjiS (DUF1127 family)